MGDREDAGFFISGSTDCTVNHIHGYFVLPYSYLCTVLLNDAGNKVVMLILIKYIQVKIWDPSLRGSELRATLKGHKGFLLFTQLASLWLFLWLYSLIHF